MLVAHAFVCKDFELVGSLHALPFQGTMVVVDDRGIAHHARALVIPIAQMSAPSRIYATDADTQIGARYETKQSGVHARPRVAREHGGHHLYEVGALRFALRAFALDP